MPHEDYIANKPESFKLLTQEQFQTAKDHSTILEALNEKPMTVKEIHNLYRKDNKHTKTLKTIYRYMETLEQNNLVQIAGYRKPENSRTTEKIYQRTARVFFNKEQEHHKEWINTPTGQEYIKATTHLLWALNHPNTPPPPELETLIQKHTQQTEEQLNTIIQRLTTEPELTTILDQYNLKQIKQTLETVPILQTIIQTDTLEQIKKTLKK